LHTVPPEKFRRAQKVHTVPPEEFRRAQKAIPMTFEYLRSNGRIPKHRNPNTGYSDHFPIFGTIETLP